MNPIRQAAERTVSLPIRDALQASATYPEPAAVYAAYQALLAERRGKRLEDVQAVFASKDLPLEMRAALPCGLDGAGWVYGTFLRPATEYWGIGEVARVVPAERGDHTPFDYVVFDAEAKAERWPELRLISRPW